MPARAAVLVLMLIVAAPARTAQRAECHGAAAAVDPRVAAGRLTDEIVAKLGAPASSRPVRSLPGGAGRQDAGGPAGRMPALQETSGRRRTVSTPGEPALIDDEIFGAMRAAGIRPAPPATDEEFLRRVSLDLTGQIPTPEEVESFLADRRANKRALLVERLLASDAFTDRWTLFLGDLFRNTTQPFVGGVFSPFRNQTHDYLRASVRDGKPYDQLARELITAAGHGAEVPQANFLIRDFLFGDDPVQDVWDNLAVSSHKAFLGVNLFCVSCHNGAGHTTQLSPWLTTKRREEFWASAAFFARVYIRPAASSSNYDQPFQVTENAASAYLLGTTNGNKTPRLPDYAGGRTVIEPEFILTGEKPAAGENPRAALARMITSHPQFARATVNYLWKEMFVTGIVEPVNGFDLLRQDPATTPAGWTTQPTHPRLLALLGDYFVKSGFDLRAVLRLMANSKTYQLSSTYPGTWRPEYSRYFARHFARRLRAEEALDAISAATGVWEPIVVADGRGRSRTVLRAGQLPDVAEPLQESGPDVRPFLDAFMRGNRNDTPRSDELALSQSLMMLNSPVVTQRIEAPSSRARELLANGTPPGEIVRRLYLATLGRQPTAAESAAAVALLDGSAEAVEDLQYALINRLEFVFNH